MKKTILITDYPSHYRQEIFEKLSDIGVDFNFSDKKSTIKPIDFNTLKTSVKVSKYFKIFGGLAIVPKAIFESLKYTNIIITGDFRSVHAWVILLLAPLTGKRVFLWGHSWYGREGHIKKIIKRFYFAPAYKILTYGVYAKELMIKEGFDAKKIVSIHNSLSYEKQLVLREEILSSNDKNITNKYQPYVVFIGRISAIKRLDLVVDALCIIKEKYHKSIKFIIIGPEIDSGALRNHVSEKQITDQVFFLGPIYNEKDIATWIYDAGVCVSPGEIGLTAIHALSFGAPAISHCTFASQMPEFEAIIPNKTGLFYEENSVDSLAESIYKMINVTEGERKVIRKACFDEIDRVWNTRYQMEVFTNILE